eukprot:3365510-Amphidinium_carterae.2
MESIRPSLYNSLTDAAKIISSIAGHARTHDCLRKSLRLNCDLGWTTQQCYTQCVTQRRISVRRPACSRTAAYAPCTTGQNT